MTKKNQPLIVKVTFHLTKTFNREQGAQFTVIGRCQTDYEQTAKSRFIHAMLSPGAGTESLN